MQPISAVIIAYNESENIERVCKSVQWCDEIIVVDSGSSDNTIELAKNCGARVVSNTFQGFGQQKSFAVNQAKNNWVLSIDSDEEISEELQKSILDLPDSPEESGFWITRVDKFDGKLLKHTLGSFGKVVRLFNKESGNFNTLDVHEYVEIEGSTKVLPGIMYHYSYKNISSYFDKFNKYTSMQAQVNFDKGKRTSPIQIMFRFPLALGDAIFIKRGFLDGYEGVLMGIFHALYSTVKYAKLLEIQKKNA